MYNLTVTLIFPVRYSAVPYLIRQGIGDFLLRYYSFKRPCRQPVVCLPKGRQNRVSNCTLLVHLISACELWFAASHPQQPIYNQRVVTPWYNAFAFITGATWGFTNAKRTGVGYLLRLKVVWCGKLTSPLRGRDVLTLLDLTGHSRDREVQF